jgi:predicted metal-dependent enzyme (double-stranded beta helix superfamily)
VYLHDALRHHDLPIDTRLLDGPALPPDELTAVTERFAADRTTWDPIVRHDPEQRWYTQLLLTDVVEVWLIGWAPGQRTRPHDHGGAAGALTVADGELYEVVFTPDATTPGTLRWRTSRRGHLPATSVGFGPAHVHQVGNQRAWPATSVHAYSPPLLPMNFPDVGWGVGLDRLAGAVS